MRAPLASALVLAAVTLAVPVGALATAAVFVGAVLFALATTGCTVLVVDEPGDDDDDDDDGGEGDAAEGEGEGEAAEGEGEEGEGEEGEGEEGEDIDVNGETGLGVCTNGVDDDGDGFVDCSDFGCDGFGGCGIAENSLAACTDGVDNDGDSYVDCVDFNCENVGTCGDPERDDATCGNGVDDDADGATDCDDLGCATVAVCRSDEGDDATCADGADNDGDGAIDCDDAGCVAAAAVCNPFEDGDAACADGVDNDDDGFLDCNDFDCDTSSVCVTQAIRVVHWNVQELFGGDAPSAQGQAALDAVTAILVRMDADVACLNEVHDDEVAALAALAEDAGYPFVFQTEISTPMAGGLTNACLSRRPFSVARSRSSDDIASDADANETGRDFAEVRVDVVPGVSSVTILSAHLKAGFANADFFRRHVEAVRIADLVEEVRATRPDDAIVVMGDMNEEIGDEDDTVYASLPPGMPASYRLGDDVALPLTYGPLTALLGAGLTATFPTREDSTDPGTRIPSGRRIDYQLFDGLTLLGDLVYDPCRDDEVDAPPSGGLLVLAGDPVACELGVAASDHWPVVADYAP